jgi:hypothetical protein
VEVFARRQRVELSGAARRNNCGEWMFEHGADVLFQRIDVDRQIAAKRRDWKSDDASESLAKTCRGGSHEWGS